MHTRNVRFPEEVLRARVRKLQELLRERGIDVAVIRTFSSFIYFTGVKWLRPSLIIPAEGEPIAFVAKGEEEGFREVTWVKDVRTFVDGGDLMGKVSSLMKSMKVKRAGMDFSLERDAYILFYEIFKRLNRGVEVVDIGEALAEMKMIKDEVELSYIREAGKKANLAIGKAINAVKPGVSETEIAAEAYATLYRLGSEEPLVYVNAGPHPRVHAEPFSTVRVREGTTVTVVVGADHFRYYANKSRTIIVGNNSKEIARNAFKAMEEAYETAVKMTKPGVKYIDVIREIDKIYVKYNLINYRVIGYTHGVGLQIEEPPITTIVPRHRFMTVKQGMALAMIHAPLLIPGLGQVKKEDTFIIGEKPEIVT